MALAPEVDLGAARHDRAAFRSFVDSYVAGRADDYDREQRLPHDILAALAEHGYWGAALPTSAGGAGMDMVTLGALHEEIGRGCSSLRSLLTVHTMVAATLHRWGGERAKRCWLAELATGRRLGAFCLTEPEVGSDARAITSTARRDGADYLVDGTKKWITGGQLADLFLVFARCGEEPAAFLVEADAPGVRVEPVSDLLGTRASMLAQVHLTDVRVPAWARLGREGAGMLVLTHALDLGRYSVAAGCVGIMQACLDASVDYTGQRRQGGQPLRERQLVRRLISDMVTRLHAARLLCVRAGELKDAGDPATLMATWVAKYFASTSAMRTASDAVQLHGANGCTEGTHSVSRYFRDAKVMEIIEGSSQIQQLVIADDAYQHQPGAPGWSVVVGRRA
ncbi:acyl-CoA dehydrogenase family protein [Goodfellowiella coeruleoviolacea]|uniref:Acyl-CoA dehydrogenase n=1 Tax=Goodfellowiella coeruleoviolacea TaxID=334858 RepID=A0AAE3KJJ3_9PSEU|nr:acyl-CoA dehydrogenase family protein [Goodfellowiella coeruleoviolacea]MCP2168454.1 hypothetical protein [Goodfellowiella coeruleoviolacea]